MKLIPIIFFVFLCQIYSDEVTPSKGYSYFSEKDIQVILDNKSENEKWKERAVAYRDFLLRPNIEEYKGYAAILQLESEKDLEEYSYNAYKRLDISEPFKALFSTIMDVNGFIVGANLAALCSEIESAVLLDSVSKRADRFYVKDNTPGIAGNYTGDQELKARKGDTDLAYIIRRLINVVSKANGESAGTWALLCKALKDTKYSDWSGAPITLNIAYKILNLCFLADNNSPDSFGTKIMKLVESINSDPRVKANNLGINYFKLNASDIFADLDKSVYFPLFVPKGSKLVYGPMDIINYITHGEMRTPIARVYGDKELKLVGNEIIDSECLLAPAKGLTNSIPIGPISSKNSKKVFTKDKEFVTDDSEVYTRLSNDVSFKELATNLLNTNIVASGDDLPSANVRGMIITNNTDKRSPLFNGKSREVNQVGLHDTVAVLFHAPQTDGSTIPPELLSKPEDLQKLGWYGGYTVYHLPLVEVYGKILDEPMPDSKDEMLKTVDGIIVEAAPEADIGKKIEDVSKYWVYENTKP